MLKQILIPISHQTEWESHLLDIPHGPAHTWRYNHAIAMTSQFPTYLYSATAKDFKAICPLSIRHKTGNQDIVSTYGFGGLVTINTYAEFNHLFKQFFIQENFVCGYIALHPFYCNSIQFDETYTANPVYILDLSPPTDVIFNHFSKIHRYEIRQVSKAQTQANIIFDKTTLKQFLPTLYRQMLMRINASSTYYFSNETLEFLIEHDQSLVSGIAINGKIESIMIFLYTQHIADYFLNANSLIGRHFSRYLIWENIKQLKKLNIPLLNLGGGVRMNDHLDNFKRRFGGKKFDCHVLQHIYDKEKFNFLCQQHPAQESSKTKYYFPPYHI